LTPIICIFLAFIVEFIYNTIQNQNTLNFYLILTTIIVILIGIFVNKLIGYILFTSYEEDNEDLFSTEDLLNNHFFEFSLILKNLEDKIFRKILTKLES